VLQEEVKTYHENSPFELITRLTKTLAQVAVKRRE